MTTENGARPGPQIESWIRQIHKELAAGLEMDRAIQEARVSLEAMIGRGLEPAQIANWQAAAIEVRRSFDSPVEFLEPNSLRRPRRPDWYRGPAATDAQWPALRSYLISRKRWDARTVESLDHTSTEVVRLLENPAQPLFSGRGLVIGYVQSGKTANMLAVISKAVDAGYKFVIILAGLTNSLRRQTQGRFESDLRARLPEAWHLHTSYGDDGDFREPANTWFSTMDQTQVAIMKKNVAPLGRLIQTLEKTPDRLRRRMPVLVIDDECDQASVNASGSQFDTTAINSAIRRVLQLLPRAQYVGYTATPFANVLINPVTPQGQTDDLYPEDFITALPLPLGYFGAEALFGKEPVDAGAETRAEEGFDMVREVPAADAATVKPPSARDREDFEPVVPPSLDAALTYFVLAVAARYARGQDDQHCAMLVHTTVYNVTHERLAGVIRDWLGSLRATLGDGVVERRLQDVWITEAPRVDSARFALEPVVWDALRPHLPRVLDDLEVMIENSTSESRLDFDGGPRKYIVVGGSVLARGLTIEGLTVSYFVRSSSQYDTLLQMGRWFGYRPGYADLPRIWMTADLSAAFRDLAAVEAEIREDIAEYVRRDETPADFAVRIRQIPGMAITAASKMIAAETCDVSFSGEHLQTVRFLHRDPRRLDSNWEAGASLVERAARVSRISAVPAGRLIRGAPLDAAIEFLEAYSASSADRLSDDLVTYIRSEHEADPNAYARWNIGIVEPADGNFSHRPLGAFGPVRLVNRSRLAVPRRDGAADIKALMSRRDVLLDVEGVDGRGDWTELKRRRQAVVGAATPLLLLYAIAARSMPPAGSAYRLPLDAAVDVLGVGLVLPDRGALRRYVRVRLDPAGNDGEDLLADLPASAA